MAVHTGSKIIQIINTKFKECMKKGKFKTEKTNY